MILGVILAMCCVAAMVGIICYQWGRGNGYAAAYDEMIDAHAKESHDS